MFYSDFKTVYNTMKSFEVWNYALKNQVDMTIESMILSNKRLQF